MRLVLSFLILAGILFPLAGPGAALGAAPHFSVESVVWEFGRDYPEGGIGDSALPINTVYLKTHDGTDWMSVYDQHRDAITGPDALKNAIGIYKAQGIETVAWFVPKGLDIDTQVDMAKQVIDAGAAALYADVEPYDGFCHLDCPQLAREFWPRLRAERPQAELGVIYDPRPGHWEDSGLSEWMRFANTALPMCYWASFVDQPPWNDPAGCVKQAKSDLSLVAPGVALQYVPMLQGDAPPDQVKGALAATTEVGATRASVWRRGVVVANVWAAIADYRITVDARLAEPPDPCLYAHRLWGRRAQMC